MSAKNVKRLDTHKGPDTRPQTWRSDHRPPRSDPNAGSGSASEFKMVCAEPRSGGRDRNSKATDSSCHSSKPVFFKVFTPLPEPGVPPMEQGPGHAQQSAFINTFQGLSGPMLPGVHVVPNPGLLMPADYSVHLFNPGYFPENLSEPRSFLFDPSVPPPLQEGWSYVEHQDHTLPYPYDCQSLPYPNCVPVYPPPTLDPMYMPYQVPSYYAGSDLCLQLQNSPSDQSTGNKDCHTLPYPDRREETDGQNREQASRTPSSCHSAELETLVANLSIGESPAGSPEGSDTRRSSKSRPRSCSSARSSRESSAADPYSNYAGDSTTSSSGEGGATTSSSGAGGPTTSSTRTTGANASTGLTGANRPTAITDTGKKPGTNNGRTKNYKDGSNSDCVRKPKIPYRRSDIPLISILEPNCNPGSSEGGTDGAGNLQADKAVDAPGWTDHSPASGMAGPAPADVSSDTLRPTAAARRYSVRRRGAVTPDIVKSTEAQDNMSTKNLWASGRKGQNTGAESLPGCGSGLLPVPEYGLAVHESWNQGVQQYMSSASYMYSAPQQYAAPQPQLFYAQQPYIMPGQYYQPMYGNQYGSSLQYGGPPHYGTTNPFNLYQYPAQVTDATLAYSVASQYSSVQYSPSAYTTADAPYNYIQ